LNLKGRIEHDDWIAQAKALLAEATAGEVPAEKGGGEENADTAEGDGKPAKKAKKKKDA
jgi:hypothetical protein